MKESTDVCTVADAPDSVQRVLTRDEREDALLRDANGIIDAGVFPRLRLLGVAESDLHAAAMRAVRQVQWGADLDGSLSALLGVERVGVNGTRAIGRRA